MRRLLPRLALIVVAVLATMGTAEAQKAAPQFKLSELPPPGPDANGPSPSLYDLLATSDVSPEGTPAVAVKPAALFDKAESYQASNPVEASYWLKRAILIAPDETGKRRAWAAMTLGFLVYNSGDATAHASARALWEMAGAWNNATALCDLGELFELGDDVTAADPKAAIVWYGRGKKAGCAEADAALARLNR